MCRKSDDIVTYNVCMCMCIYIYIYIYISYLRDRQHDDDDCHYKSVCMLVDDGIAACVYGGGVRACVRE